ncbi:MarR family transcriptional regulator [Nocardioides sp. JQ2195]|uniref:MarR family winged helix-turn-helix transcriptional regulator n=1 Tax=Nocardioides sp. JQ2195 TaxID=2592334 RepID=UPI00143E9EE9|nr:MarR family transcriptional regulator [Nocardioides sp. JQ2195]QIX27337.1 MarR family transcriptional regulator [Nocardioides sp. JQ2195]
MDNQNDVIEQQLFTLLRRTQAIHIGTASGDVELERSSYGILCLLADEGPQRLGAIAQTFRLDPSTITRQVQTVVRLGLAEKSVDENDRRASLLELTELGAAAVAEARDHRREMLDRLLAAWTPDERAEFLRSLQRFNATVEKWIEHGTPT